VSPASLPAGTAGTAYSQTLSASGGTPSYSFATTAGSMPPGIVLSAGGVLSGTPSSAGTYNFTVTATDSNDCTGSRAYSLVIDCPTITVTPGSLPAGTAGTAYSQSVSATPAGTTYGYQVTAGSLPAGLTLNPTTGAITGTPTASGTFDFTVTATGWGSCTGSRAYSVAIGCPTITVSPATLPDGHEGVAYSQSVGATGGTGPYGYATADPLPAGLTLSAAGLVSGTPGVHGSFSFTVTATDAVGCTGSQLVSLTIQQGGAAPTITSAAGATFSVGKAGSFVVTTTGDPAPSISRTGNLPSGVSFVDNGNGTATLAGTPAAGTGGSYPVSLTASNGTLPDAGQSFTLTVIGSERTTLALVASANPAPLGALVRFTAKVAFYTRLYGTPTGTVQFRIDGVPQGGPVPLVSAQAAIQLTTLTPGSHTVSATYSGDGNFQPSSGTLTEVIVGP
jgi:hypothetical protein